MTMNGVEPKTAHNATDKAVKQTCINLFQHPNSLSDISTLKNNPQKDDALEISCSEVELSENGSPKTGPSLTSLPNTAVNGEPATAVEQNAAKSRFLRLPLEIRYMIYGYVFGGKEYFVYERKEPACALMYEKKTDRELLSVCKQIYLEAALLPIRLSAFYVWPHQVLAWFETEKFTVAQEDAISILRVNFPAVRYDADFLRYFWGLRRVYVSWTRENHSHEKLASIAVRLRKDAGKPHLGVIFVPEDEIW